LDDERLRTVAFDCFRYFLGAGFRRGRDVVDHDVRSLLGESDCGGSTDALYRTSILENKYEAIVRTRAEPVTIATFPESEDMM